MGARRTGFVAPRVRARASAAGGVRRLAGRRPFGGRPISGLRPLRTPAPSRVRPRSRDRRAPHTRRRNAATEPSHPRTATGRRGQDRTQQGWTRSPEGVGSDGVWGVHCCERAVNALVRRKAGSVPRGGALARSKRLAGCFARLAACKRRGDEEWCAHGQGRNEASPSSRTPAPAHPHTRAPAHPRNPTLVNAPPRPPPAHPIQRKSDGPRLQAFLVSAPESRHVTRIERTRRAITSMAGGLGAADVAWSWALSRRPPKALRSNASNQRPSPCSTC